MQVKLASLISTLALVFFVQPSFAQSVTGQISGSVVDPTGSSVPGAVVQAINNQTGLTVKEQSKSNGEFQFLHLPAGSYDITVSKAGFQAFTAKGAVLSLNQVYRITASLQVGNISQSVEVQADEAQVEVSTTQLGTVIDSRQIVDLPLNGRDWTQLEQLSPGVVAGSDRFGGGDKWKYLRHQWQPVTTEFIPDQRH